MKISILILLVNLFQVNHAPYTIINDSIYEEYYSDGTSKRIEHKKVLINNKEGAEDWHRISIRYSPIYNTASYINAKVLKKNSSVVKVDVKKATDEPVSSFGGTIFWGDRQKVLSIKNLEQGDTVDYTFEKLGGNWQGPNVLDGGFKTPYAGYFTAVLLFESYVPIIHKVYVLKELADKKVRFGIYNGKINYSKKGNLLIFSVDSVNASHHEYLSGSVYDNWRKLVISNFKNYREMSAFEYRRSDKNCSPTGIIRQFTDSILQGCNTDSAKIARLFYFVADEIRYLGLVETDQEGYKPHSATITLLHREGVCKDKAALLVALLRAAGFKAYYTVTSVGSRVERIPADQTNHAICALETAPLNYSFLDPTIGAGGRDFLPPSEELQQVIVSRAHGDTLRTIPLSAPERNGYSVNIEEYIEKDSSYATISFTEKRGYDQAFRRMLSSIPYYRIKRMFESYNVTVDTVILGDAYNYKKYYSFTVKVKITGSIKRIGNLLLIRPIALNPRGVVYGFFNTLFRMTNVRRTYPAHLRFTQQITANETLKLPSYLHVIDFPGDDSFSVQTEPYASSYYLKTQKHHIYSRLTIGTKIVPVDLYRQFYKIKEHIMKTGKFYYILGEQKE